MESETKTNNGAESGSSLSACSAYQRGYSAGRKKGDKDRVRAYQQGIERGIQLWKEMAIQYQKNERVIADANRVIAAFELQQFDPAI